LLVAAVVRADWKEIMLRENLNDRGQVPPTGLVSQLVCGARLDELLDPARINFLADALRRDELPQSHQRAHAWIHAQKISMDDFGDLAADVNF
jgi:hypothetical protein